MKKSAILKLFSLVTFAAAGVFAIANSSSSQKAEAVKADSTVDYGNSGLVYLELNTGDWKYTGSKIALYMFNDSVSKNAWGDFVTPDGTSRYIEYPYSLDFTPQGCIAFRFDPGVETCGQWCFDNDRSNSAVWSTTNDITFKKVIALGQYYEKSKWTTSSSHDLLTEVKGGATDDWKVATVDVQLTHTKITNGNTLEVYGEVELPAGTYFKVVKGGSVWCDNYNAEDAIKSNFTGGSGSNIHNTAAGTYEFYFAYEGASLWIADPITAAADEWAQNFLGANCIATKSNWAAQGVAFGNLGAKSQALLAGQAHIDHNTEATSYIAQAVQRYDYIIELYGITGTGSFSDFMGRVEAGKVVPKSAAPFVSYNTPDSNNLIVIVSIVSLISASTLVGLIVIKRRRGIAK